jgi:hypothetical protein
VIAEAGGRGRRWFVRDDAVWWVGGRKALDDGVGEPDLLIALQGLGRQVGAQQGEDERGEKT